MASTTRARLGLALPLLLTGCDCVCPALQGSHTVHADVVFGPARPGTWHLTLSRGAWEVACTFQVEAMGRVPTSEQVRCDAEDYALAFDVSWDDGSDTGVPELRAGTRAGEQDGPSAYALRLTFDAPGIGAPPEGTLEVETRTVRRDAQGEVAFEDATPSPATATREQVGGDCCFVLDHTLDVRVVLGLGESTDAP
ncbi:MAG: hypothetical protein KDK70_41355 [Myxococcales bacterium]|nr:hypothetical protein [Myxococcales bacterium]MCB9663274.1 hypothetical protein [Alphaproteobacteria bacterium]